MAENVGAVFWEVEIDASGMLRGMRQVDRRLDDLNGNLNNTTRGIRAAFNPANMRRLAGGVAKAVGAATVAFVAFAAAVGNSGKELEVMARQAGVTIEQFQAIQYATEQYTVSGEQFADVTKDMSDKLGEFAAVGTGPFQDYIDVMKLTEDQGRDLAQQLQNLAGPQAIQFLVSEMENAGTSGAQMTFVLESMGNDLSKLIPLFSNSGAELDKLTSKFEQVAGGISADTFKEYRMLSGNMGLATKSFTNFLAEALTPLIPAFDAAAVSIAGFFKEFTDGSKEANKFRRQQEEINALINEGSTGSGRTKRTTYGSPEAKEIDNLIKKNQELEKQINKTSKTGNTRQRGPSSPERSAQKKASLEAFKQLSRDELEINKARIEELKKESAIALQVFNIRKGITAEEAKGTGGGTTTEKPTTFQGIDPLGDKKEGFQLPSLGGEAGEFGSFDNNNPFNVMARTEAEDGSDKMAEIISNYEMQKQALLESFESPAERVKREYDEQIGVITAYEEEKLEIAKLNGLSAAEIEAEIATEKLNAFKSYEEKKTQIAKDEEEKRSQGQQLTLSQAGNFFGTMADLAAEGGEKSFKAWKAFAIAQAIISTSQAVMNAMANIPAPFNYIAAGAAGAMGAVQIAKIRGSQYSGRAQGGPVKAGNIYPVNEAGTEGFQFRSGGKEYLQPMTDGKVVKNSEMKKGGGGDNFSISNSYNIQAIDTTTAAQLIEQNQESVYQAVLNAANERGGF